MDPFTARIFLELTFYMFDLHMGNKPTVTAAGGKELHCVKGRQYKQRKYSKMIKQTLIKRHKNQRAQLHKLRFSMAIRPTCKVIV